MEENNTQIEQNMDTVANPTQVNSQKPVVGAILIVGILIAGAILLKDSKPREATTTKDTNLTQINLAPVNTEDRTLGNPNAKIKLVMYEDFQCPFCGRFFNDTEQQLKTSYIQNGDLELIYRDFAFLGPESVRAAEAAWCANDQGKFWEYHEYLFTHQNGENQGNFADKNLKTFAKTVGLNSTDFNKCLDSGKYLDKVNTSKTEATMAQVSGTPKGFLVTEKEISKKTQEEINKALNLNSTSQPIISFYTDKHIMSINGALPFGMVKAILDILLK